MNQELVIAELETRSFTFRAVGVNKVGARSAMRAIWTKHRKVSGASYTWKDIEDDVTYWTATPGVALRDFSEWK